MLSVAEPRLSATKVVLHDERQSSLVYRGADMESLLAGLPPRWKPDSRPVGRVVGPTRAWAAFEIPKALLAALQGGARFELVDEQGAVASGCILTEWKESVPGVLSCQAEAGKIEWEPAAQRKDG